MGREGRGTPSSSSPTLTATTGRCRKSPECETPAGNRAEPGERTMQKIVTSLWFDDEAEEAAKFYCSIFPNSKVTKLSRYGSAGPRPEGMVMAVDFELDGQGFNALNGGPEFRFTEATSLLVNCQTQEEVDGLWEKLG